MKVENIKLLDNQEIFAVIIRTVDTDNDVIFYSPYCLKCDKLIKSNTESNFAFKYEVLSCDCGTRYGKINFGSWINKNTK